MFTLDEVVPWGRSFDEYRRMFALTGADLALTIVGCGDGPAAFNAEATARGARVMSCDPIYRWGVAQLRERIAAAYDSIMRYTRENAGEFTWKSPIESVEQLGQVRMQAMRLFLEDFEAGRAAGRYVDAALPTLPFPDRTFDLALCSHFLFLYTRQLDEAFHLAAVQEMCRVATEVRIFPLLALGGEVSPYVETCVATFRAAGFAVSVEQADYEFQRGGNQMLRIRQGGRS